MKYVGFVSVLLICPQLSHYWAWERCRFLLDWSGRGISFIKLVCKFSCLDAIYTLIFHCCASEMPEWSRKTATVGPASYSTWFSMCVCAYIWERVILSALNAFCWITFPKPHLKEYSRQCKGSWSHVFSFFPLFSPLFSFSPSLISYHAHCTFQARRFAHTFIIF